MPGTKAEQEAKLEVLDRIRSRLTPRVLYDMSEEERKELLDMKPPDYLHVLEPKDLPPLLQRRFTENDGTLGTVFYVKTGPRSRARTGATSFDSRSRPTTCACRTARSFAPRAARPCSRR